MSRTARWLLAALAIGTAAPAAELVNLGFDTPPGWTLPAAWAVADGELRATVSASHARLLVPETAGLVNQTVRVTIRQIDGQVSQLRAGLIFRAPDADNGYFVLIRGDGAYWLGKLVGGKPIPTLTGFVGAVRTSGPNTITVVCEGERQSISLNDTRLLSRSDPAYAYGGVGLWAEGTGTAAFDGLCIADDSPEPPRVDTAPAATTVPRVAEAPGGEPPRPAAPVLDPALPEPTERQPLPETGERPTPEPPAVTPATPREPAVEPPPSPPSRPTTPPDTARPETEPARPAAPVVTPPAAGGPLFSEDFDPPKHRWDVDGLRRIESGEIRIRAVAGYLLSGQALPLTDYTAAVRARAMSSGGGTYGLVTRLQRDAQSGYLFLLRDPDVFAVARLDAGKPILLRRGEVAVTAGWNQLEVDCLGGLFVFRVNGAVVASFSDDRYATGGVGLWVDNHRQAAFDDLLVTAAERPDTSGSGRELPLPEPDRKVLLEERFDPPQLAWLEDEQRRIVEGALELRSEEGRFAISGAPESRTGDYQVQVEATRLDGPDRGLHGLLVRLQPDSRSGYLLAVYGGGRYLVLRFDAEGYVTLARGETPLRPGANTLAAACQGAELQFLVNGTVVTRLTDTTYPGGGFGLYADNGVVARFDNLLATTTVSQ